MRMLFLFSLILILSVSHSFAQGKAIDNRYNGGGVKLREFLAQNLKYPVLSMTNKIVGYSITSITITPDGKITEVSSINPLDNYIDKDIKRVIELTRKNWLKSDSTTTNQTFYIQIAYTISLGRDSNSDIRVHSPVKCQFNFIEPVELTAVVFKKADLPEPDENIAIRCGESMKNEDYAEALKCISELIKRNPFNKELYQIRISINQRLKKNDLLRQDLIKMQNFIPGVSLDELIEL